MDRYKICIVGAGPAGSHLAKLLRKRNQTVHLFEEHGRIGTPVQCTGIVTNSLFQYVKVPSEVIRNRVSEVKIYSDFDYHINLKFAHPDYILDREKFDRYLAMQAKNSGVKIYLGHKFIGMYKGDNNIVCEFLVGGRRKYYFFDYVIGADGPLSTVAKSADIFGKRNMWSGIQVILKSKNKNEIEFYPFIGKFAWVVPEDNNTLRVGVVSKSNTKKYLKLLLRNRFGNRLRIIDTQAGVIPEFDFSTRTSKEKIFLLGDAATQVKATTGGGIIQSLQAAEILANTFDRRYRYPMLWRFSIGRDLLMHKIIRKTLDNMEKKDLALLVKKFRSKRLRKLLESIEREYPFRLCWKIFFADPTLLRFVRFYFR